MSESTQWESSLETFGTHQCINNPSVLITELLWGLPLVWAAQDCDWLCTPTKPFQHLLTLQSVCSSTLPLSSHRVASSGQCAGFHGEGAPVWPAEQGDAVLTHQSRETPHQPMPSSHRAGSSISLCETWQLTEAPTQLQVGPLQGAGEQILPGITPHSWALTPAQSGWQGAKGLTGQEDNGPWCVCLFLLDALVLAWRWTQCWVLFLWTVLACTSCTFTQMVPEILELLILNCSWIKKSNRKNNQSSS